MKKLWSIPCLLIFLIQTFVSFGQPGGAKPVITGQTPSPLSTLRGTPITITLANLIVTPADPTSVYPDGFTLEVGSEKHYKVNGTTVTPDLNFTGLLKVRVRVFEGKEESKWFDLKIDVKETATAAPRITGQTPITISQSESFTITFAHLTVADSDDNYPSGFTLTVHNGNNYTVNGTTVTPAPNFSGNLKVKVSVNDGENESNRFDLKIEVLKPEDTAPKITGQVPISVNQGQSVTVTFSHLIVADPDNNYPSGFTLSVYNGNNYTVNGTIVTPAPNFSGNLKVKVSVNDGENESKHFDLKIDVLKVQPSSPQITGQKALTVNEDESIEIKLTDLVVTDPDNNFPQDFTLKISPGPHYTINGSTVVGEKNYSGPLSVVVRVNDGKNDSPPFNLQITVVPVNDSPLITEQKKLSANQGTPFSINLSDLTVTDPDNKYPDDFTLKIAQGNNYVAAGSTINPSATFVGTLNVIVSVSDGTASSPDFNVQVEIVNTKTNVAPTIVGQKAISITQNTSITLQLFHLVVDDPDNEFPAGFSLRVFPGTNYTVTGTKVTPAAGFVNGTLRVGVRVNDGSDDSQLYEVKIQVTPISATPRINGQKELTVLEDKAITITLSDLFVTDADNSNYPQGFTLRVLSDGEGVYKTNGNTVTPALNLNGFIEVGVTVSDGLNTSDEFRLAILVTPVNDAPVVTLLESSPLSFEPGKGTAEIFRRLGLADVDNEYLSMAEIGFRNTNHSPENDELLFDYENPKIRAIQDPAGILFLIGNATVEEYQAALRTIKYNYRITEDLNGKPEGILSGPRTIYVTASDGQSVGLSSERIVEIEAKVEIDIPNAFTPNGDDANDTWRVQLLNKDRLDQAIIKVYNKRGLLVYGAEGFEKEWDGMFNGERLPTDTYYYTIVVKLPYMRQTYSGVVTILY
jgi:gliding motility-associated-like protein